MKRVLYLFMTIIMGASMLVGCGSKEATKTVKETALTNSFVNGFKDFQAFKANKINKEIKVTTESDDGKKKKSKTSRLSMRQVVDGDKKETVFNISESKSGDVKVDGDLAVVLQDGDETYISLKDSKKCVKDDKKLASLLKTLGANEGTVDKNQFQEKIGDKLDTVKTSKLDSVSRNNSYVIVSALRLLANSDVPVAIKNALIDTVDDMATTNHDIKITGSSLTIEKKDLVKALDKVGTKIKAGTIEDKTNWVSNLSAMLEAVDDDFDIEMSVDTSDKTSILDVSAEEVEVGKGFESDITLSIVKAKSDDEVKTDIPNDAKDITKKLAAFLGGYIDRESVKETQTAASAKSGNDDEYDDDDYYYDDDDYDYDDDDYDYDDDYDDDDYDDCDDGSHDGGDDYGSQDNSYYDKNIE